MGNWTVLFIGIGFVVAIIGACIVLFNRAADERTRQSGLVFLAAGLVIALMTATHFGHAAPFTLGHYQLLEFSDRISTVSTISTDVPFCALGHGRIQLVENEIFAVRSPSGEAPVRCDAVLVR